MKEKLITIDYEEYLELEKCKKVIDDLKNNFKTTLQVDQGIDFTVTESIEMPESFRTMFWELMNENKVSKLIMVNKREQTIRNRVIDDLIGGY